MKIKKFVALLLVCSMMTPIASASSVLEENGSTFEGNFVISDTESSNVDLSQIEIEVYQSTPTDQVVPDYIEYEETYLYSVYTDADGKFSFSIPSQTFSITIVLDSLPTGMGIRQQSKLYHANTTSDTFSLYEIVDAEMNMAALNVTPEVTFLARDGNPVLSDYDISYDLQLKGNDTVIAIGTAHLPGNVDIDISTTCDLSDFSTVEKCNQLYLAGLIDEEDQILAAVSLLSGTESNLTQADVHDYEPEECGTAAADLLAEYKESNKYSLASNAVKNAVNNALSRKIDQPASSVLSDESRAEIAASVPSKSNSYFTVYYNDGVSEATATQTLSFLTNIRSKALEEGFKLPRLETGKNTLQVYLFSETSGYNGITYATNISNGTAASYIEIWGIDNWSAQWGETVAHEYFHAIQNAYFYYNNWFKEAGAVWFAAKYANSIERAKSKFNSYFSNCALGIEHSDNNYGAGVFPMAIDVAYGGTSTIRKIYENLDRNNANINASMLRDNITDAIQSYDSTGSFERTLEITAAYITYPSHFYRKIIPSGASWDNTRKKTGTSPSSTNLSSFGCQPVKYTASSSTPKTMSIIIDFAGMYTDGKTSARVVLKSGNNITPIGDKTTNSRYTAEITNFCTRGNSVIDIVPIYYNSTWACTATISVSYS